MAQKLSSKEALQRAGRFCALRERSPQEVLEKLLGWGLLEDDALVVVGKLQEDGYINEQRFANAFCHDKFEFNSWGKQKIRASIYPHRLPKQMIEEALNRIDEQHYESRLRSLAEKKWNALQKEALNKRKQKTASYLASKGFEPELIWRVINSLSGKGH